MGYATPMADIVHQRLVHLPRADGRLAALFARPKAMAAASVVALSALGWLYLGLLAAGAEAPPGSLARALAVLCQATPQSGIAAVFVIAPMWAAMVLAMMLPSAAPMIFTYAEIADTAARKGERIVSPIVIMSGYAAVWLGFSLAAAAAQFLLARAAWSDGTVSANAFVSGALFAGAGLYQFSALKHACLTQCQRPFPFFFAHWETTARGVFRLGVKQGLYCLGCCWAMMALMFAVGAMNVLWMAALGIVMTTEKMLAGRRFSHAVGAALLALGIVMLVLAAAPRIG
jgi:predicted metal-binding membrane protein